ncbi:hypothetical protein PTSG_01480 [Salpingoeca rosetta]|uniref:Bifunctional lysine-specific demethylase and histidyl-hydroxylase n=1 Tax=Salpingoeca rosetta (strain ATCC 50818 / BSB-021) TaxID=946362 RepID=F2U0G5_SALR5|nr:uncharacterized protein PTSG_01480 [Salpingoeca rosetta]EGD80893.1 hypothetical protein PTSG_01480 [Salpingoeca rosetta]|eukprot:XP_004997454.1 hypothetical protein PTSG_01480 [Salpingoeca rosetta]
MKGIAATLVAVVVGVLAVLCGWSTALPSEIDCPLHLRAVHDDMHMYMRPSKCTRISNDEEDPDCHCLATGERIVWPHRFQEITDLIVEGRRPLHIARDDPNYYGQLFTSSDFFRFLTFYRHKYEAGFNLVRNGDTVFANDEPVQLGDVLDSIARNGSTAVMTAVHTRDEHIWALSWALERETSLFSATNIYLTPAQSRGFIFHQDVHAVIILQLEGKKHWRLFTPPEERSFPWYHKQEAASQRLTRFFKEEELVGLQEFNFTLHAGDTLIVPRGVIHAAETSDEHSLHLTVSLDDNGFTFVNVIIQALMTFQTHNTLSAATASSLSQHTYESSSTLRIMRESLPTGLDDNARIPTEVVDAIRPRWQSAIDQLQEYCAPRGMCGATKQAFRRLRSDQGLVHGLKLPVMMNCGGHLKAMPDMGSIGRLVTLTGETRVFRRRGVFICALEDLVDEPGSLVPRILGINRKWVMQFSDEDWTLAKQMQEIPVNTVMKVADLPGANPRITAQRYITLGVLAIAD